MMNLLNSVINTFTTPNININTSSQTQKQSEDETPIDLINELKYFLALIELKNKYNTCFFINLNKKNNSDSYFLCTSSNFISKEDIESKKTVKIFLGEKYLDTISIKLDKDIRKIMQFKNIKEIMLIQIIPEIDNISSEKFLKIYNGNYEQYIGQNAKDVYISGFKNYFSKEISTINCKIINLKNSYGIIMDIEEKYFLSCSPIFIINLYDDDIFQILGFQIEYDILQDPHGYIFGPIIDTLEDFIPSSQDNNTSQYSPDEDEANADIIQNIITNNNVSTNINTDEMKKLQHNYFYTLQEYKQHVIKLHNLISKHYVSQNTTNFLNHYSILKDYLKKYPAFMVMNKKFLDDLEYFKDTNNFSTPIKHEIIFNLNKILSSNNLELIEMFSYFIASTMFALVSYSTIKGAFFINNGDKLYKRVNLNYEDVVRFEKNLNNIILFKTFVNEMTTLEHLHGQIYRYKIDSSFKKKLNKFDTQIFIINHYDAQHWKPSCISLNTCLYPEKIMNLFSFFIVEKVDINYKEKTAKITLGTVGKIYFLEEKIAKANNCFKVEYNRIDNIMEVL